MTTRTGAIHIHQLPVTGWRANSGFGSQPIDHANASSTIEPRMTGGARPTKTLPGVANTSASARPCVNGRAANGSSWYTARYTIASPNAFHQPPRFQNAFQPEVRVVVVSVIVSPR